MAAVVFKIFSRKNSVHHYFAIRIECFLVLKTNSNSIQQQQQKMMKLIFSTNSEFISWTVISLRISQSMTGDGCYFIICKLDFFLSLVCSVFIIYVYVCTRLSVCITQGSRYPWVQKRVSNLLELKWQTVVNCLTLILGPKPLSSARAVQLFTAKPSPHSPISEFLQFFKFRQRVCVNIGLNR